MITGDHPSTAEGIAAELGLLNGQPLVTGPMIEAASDAELDTLVADTSVYARVTPLQKLRIVTALQRAGRVVAMAGDGANDAPAIRRADIGMALGRDATSAARDAADLTVVDDRIETVVDRDPAWSNPCHRPPQPDCYGRQPRLSRGHGGTCANTRAEPAVRMPSTGPGRMGDSGHGGHGRHRRLHQRRANLRTVDSPNPP